MTQKTVLLLDADFVQSYSVARSLRESGFYVIIAADTRQSYGFYSRYPNKKLLSPKASNNEKGYKDFIKEVINEYKIDVIIPLTNDVAELISKYYDELVSMGVKLATMPWDIFIKAHNKENLMSLCEEKDIPHPRTIKLTQSNIRAAASKVGFPAMIKPNISVGARGIIRVNNLKELEIKALDILNNPLYKGATLQQFIDNGEEYYNVMMFRNSKGEIVAHVVIEIQRYFPIHAGSSSFCVTTENADLIKLCARTLNELNWIGIADFDVLLDKKEGFKIIEINPRVPASIHAAYISGVNFPEMIVNDLLGLPSKQYIYKTGCKLRFLLMDIMWFISSPKRWHSKECWFKFWDRNLYYQDTSWRDPLLIIAGIMTGLAKVFNSEYRKSKLKQNN